MNKAQFNIRISFISLLILLSTSVASFASENDGDAGQPTEDAVGSPIWLPAAAAPAQDDDAEDAPVIAPLPAAPLDPDLDARINRSLQENLAVNTQVNRQAQDCLDAIYAREADGSDAPAAEEIVVTADTSFAPHFSSFSFLENANGAQPEGVSYFLTSNQFLNSDTTFRVYESARNGSQWICGSAERLRRLSDDTDEGYDSGDVRDASNTERTTQDFNRSDQWGNGQRVSGDAKREAVYYLKIENRHFRINCEVSEGFGVHKNADCFGRPVSLGNVNSSNLKTCKASNKPVGDFIKRALRAREKTLRQNTPTTVRAWQNRIEMYNEVKNKCPYMISSHNGAQDALSDLGKEMNERIRNFNRRRPAGAGAVSPVVVFQD